MEENLSRIEKELHNKTPEEQYAILAHLFYDYGIRFTNSKGAIIEWLKGNDLSYWTIEIINGEDKNENYL